MAPFAALVLCALCNGHTQTNTAVVLDARSIDGELHTYVLRIDKERFISTFPRALPAGATIRVRGRPEPLDESRNPGEPSERSIEAEHRIVGRLESAALLAVIDSHPHAFDAWIAYAHARALALLRERLPEPGASIVAGELWGERSALPRELRAEFQETGTVHVLVTAGLHVGLIAWLMLFICERLTLPRVLSCAIAIAFVWIFTLFSGGNLPALRATTMATTVLLARAAGRATFSWQSLTIAAFVVVAVMPSTIATPSFWLSFCCVGAIFVCVPALEPFLEGLALHRRVREALLLTLATQIGTWPITAATFLQFSPYAIVANLAIVPLVPLTMTLGLLQLALTPIGTLAQAAANLNSSLLAWNVSVVHLLSALPLAIIRMTPAPVWCIAAYEGSVVLAALLVRHYRGYVPAIGSVAFAASFVLFPPQPLDTSLRITVLDVGQADAIVIQTPAHHAILVDAGGRLERGPQTGDSAAERVGERIVVPFLLRQGIHRLDALIISHPHGDHVAGCSPVLRALRVAEIADGGQTYGGHAYHDCLDAAAANHVSLVQPRAGAVWRTNDGVTLTFIGPSLPFIAGKNAINDNSVAFILQYRKFRMMFTGDAGVAAERRFLDEGISLHADILKVGHHGSAYSSSPEYIEAVHPRYAIISVGRHNLFGHPAPSTVERLQRARATLYRTDENGAVTITTDGAEQRLQPTVLVTPAPWANAHRSVRAAASLDQPDRKG